MNIKKLKSIFDTYPLKEEARLDGKQYFELNVSQLEISDLTGKTNLEYKCEKKEIESGPSLIRNILLRPDSVIVFYGFNQASGDVQEEFMKLMDISSKESDIYEVVGYN